MLSKRIIPCLDVKNGRVVKGTNFISLRDAGDPVEIAHETTRVVRERIVAFLELIHLLDHGDRDHEVVVLEFADGFVVVQDHIGVQHENLRFSHKYVVQSSPSAFCIRDSNIVCIPDLAEALTRMPGCPGTGWPSGKNATSCSSNSASR